MARFHHIIFDFDGTLADTTPLILATMKATVAHLGLDPRTDTDYRATIGLRLEDVPARLWPDNVTAARMYAPAYRRLFDTLKHTRPADCYPGVRHTLRMLKEAGVRMAIASSRNRESLREYVETFGWQGYFDAITGGNDVAQGKPSPEPVLKILEECRWDAAATLTVGDADVDIIMGRAAGTATCAVTYGNGDEASLTAAGPTFIIDDFRALIPVAAGVSPDVVAYVEKEIIPRYDAFDKAHRRDHARMVIDQSMSMAAHMPQLDIDMAYCIAAFHDLGLAAGREFHHLESARILLADSFMRRRFTESQRTVMSQAVEDHRASGKTPPRSDYGRLVADADRFIDPETIIRRTVQYGLANCPGLDRRGHYLRTVSHLTEKYGPDGYLRIWLPWSDNAARLQRLHTIMADSACLEAIFTRIFAEETSASSTPI